MSGVGGWNHETGCSGGVRTHNAKAQQFYRLDGLTLDTKLKYDIF